MVYVLHISQLKISFKHYFILKHYYGEDINFPIL